MSDSCLVRSSWNCFDVSARSSSFFTRFVSSSWSSSLRELSYSMDEWVLLLLRLPMRGRENNFSTLTASHRRIALVIVE